MSNFAYVNIASQTEKFDREHEVQLSLLQALCDAARGSKDAAAVGEILVQLIAYSEAHFVSEELLMRLKNYDDYENHVDDHIHMLDVLRQISSHHATGNSALVEGKAAEVLDFIGGHIATHDQRFVDFLRQGQ